MLKKIISSLFQKSKKKDALSKNTLYVCKDHCLVLYPDLDSARVAADMKEGAAAVSRSGMKLLNPGDVSEYWMSKINKPVELSSFGDIILVVESSGDFAEILVSNKGGWIIVKSWINLKELNSDE
jgi:hypothetical protein